MNRAQKRHAARTSRRDPKNKDAKALSQRARFESDLKEALLCEDIRLVSTDVGTVDDAQATPGVRGQKNVWVFTVHAGGRFIVVQSDRGTLANVATGVAETVKRTLASKEGSAAIEIKPSSVEGAAPRVVAPQPRLETAGEIEAPAIDHTDASSTAVWKPEMPVEVKTSAPVDESSLSLVERIRRSQSASPR